MGPANPGAHDGWGRNGRHAKRLEQARPHDPWFVHDTGRRALNACGIPRGNAGKSCVTEIRRLDPWSPSWRSCKGFEDGVLEAPVPFLKLSFVTRTAPTLIL